MLTSQIIRSLILQFWTILARFVLVFAALVASVSASLAQAGQKAVIFAPHRAIYDMSLSHSAPGSAITEMNGRMVYELSGSACDGYTQNMRFVTRFSTRKGRGQTNDLRTSSWEAGAGERLRFNSTQYLDQQLTQTTQGDAARQASDRSVDVTLAQPEERTLKFKADTYFPMQHAAALLKAARSGENRFRAILFDGSDKGAKAYETNAFIGPVFQPGTKPSDLTVQGAQRLKTLSSWPVSISYFEIDGGKTDAVPVYELSFRYFENGVTSRLVIDYGDFALAGKLREVQFFEASPCVPK